jgi:allantoicase
MVREDGKRNFVLREDDGTETSVFSGNMPRQAALKAARRLDPERSEAQAEANAEEIRLREKGTDKVHVYEAWAWEDESPDDDPEWMEGSITKGNVSKEGIRHLEE